MDMKRMETALLSAALLLSLTACGGGGENGTTVVEKDHGGEAAEAAASAAPAEETMQPLELDGSYSVPDYADFTLRGVETTRKIMCSMYTGDGTEIDEDGMVFVDLQLELSNRKTEALNSQDAVTLRAVSEAGIVYEETIYGMETDGGTLLRQYEEISPLTTALLHCGVKVPEQETAVRLELDVNGTLYSCDYTMGRRVMTVQPLELGQVIEDEKFGRVEFCKLDAMDDVLPTDCSSFYTHYEVEDPSNTYLVASFDMTNYQGSARDMDTFVGVRAIFKDQYTYYGFPLLLDDDGRGFDTSCDIPPLMPKHLYYLIEVPDMIVNESVELQVHINGVEYSFKQA